MKVWGVEKMRQEIDNTEKVGMVKSLENQNIRIKLQNVRNKDD